MNYPVGPLAARITGTILRGSICADFVSGVADALFCCKGRAGLVINVVAIIAQADKTVRVFFAVGFRVIDSFLDFNDRLGWFVNGITSLPAQRRTRDLAERDYTPSRPRKLSNPISLPANGCLSQRFGRT
jgi:hypothetical protein